MVELEGGEIYVKLRNGACYPSRELQDSMKIVVMEDRHRQGRPSSIIGSLRRAGVSDQPCLRGMEIRSTGDTFSLESSDPLQRHIHNVFFLELLLHRPTETSFVKCIGMLTFCTISLERYEKTLREDISRSGLRYECHPTGLAT